MAVAVDCTMFDVDALAATEAGPHRRAGRVHPGWTVRRGAAAWREVHEWLDGWLADLERLVQYVLPGAGATPVWAACGPSASSWYWDAWSTASMTDGLRVNPPGGGDDLGDTLVLAQAGQEGVPPGWSRPDRAAGCACLLLSTAWADRSCAGPSALARVVSSAPCLSITGVMAVSRPSQWDTVQVLTPRC